MRDWPPVVEVQEIDAAGIDLLSILSKSKSCSCSRVNDLEAPRSQGLLEVRGARNEPQATCLLASQTAYATSLHYLFFELVLSLVTLV